MRFPPGCAVCVHDPKRNGNRERSLSSIDVRMASVRQVKRDTRSQKITCRVFFRSLAVESPGDGSGDDDSENRNEGESFEQDRLSFAPHCSIYIRRRSGNEIEAEVLACARTGGVR